MTRQEAEIVLLRAALVQAQHTVAFLHGCLTKPFGGEPNGGFRYAYPEHTLGYLAEWGRLAPLQQSCHHSRFEGFCQACHQREEEGRIYYEAKSVMETT